MTNKNKNNNNGKKNKNNGSQAVTTRKNTPFRNAGATLGGLAGSLLGNPTIGRNLGALLGTGIGSIFGHGDYAVTGPGARYNVLSGQVPRFSTTSATNIITHREFLGDITGTTAFTVRKYRINPGNPQTFPWACNVAVGYQQYKIHGMAFEFKSMLTDFVTAGSPGTIVMATSYDAADDDYTNKQEMEMSEYAISAKPTNDAMHMIECARNQTVLPLLNVSDGDLPSGRDSNLYDHGNFYFATQANPNQVIGELWVTYNIELFKPKIPDQVVGYYPGEHIRRDGCTNSLPYGTNQLFSKGGNTVSFTGTTMTVTGYTPQKDRYIIYQVWSGSSSSIVAPPVNALGNCANDSSNFYLSGFTYPGSATTEVRAVNINIVKVTDTSLPFSVTLGTAGVSLPGFAIFEALIMPLDPTVI